MMKLPSKIKCNIKSNLCDREKEKQILIRFYGHIHWCASCFKLLTIHILDMSFKLHCICILNHPWLFCTKPILINFSFVWKVKHTCSTVHHLNDNAQSIMCYWCYKNILLNLHEKHTSHKFLTVYDHYIKSLLCFSCNKNNSYILLRCRLYLSSRFIRLI